MEPPLDRAADRAEGVTPTELFRSNFLGCFITDPAALRVRDRIGIEAIAWECDYPHSDSTWPRSPEMLWKEFEDAGCNDADIEAITWQNTARFFRYDPFAHIARDDATVAALRARATDVERQRDLEGRVPAAMGRGACRRVTGRGVNRT